MLKGVDTLDWNLFGGLALALFLIRWDQNNIKLINLVKELIIMGLFVLILSFILKKENLTFTLFNQLPEKIEIWVGGLLFTSFICALTHRGWRTFHTHHVNRNH